MTDSNVDNVQTLKHHMHNLSLHLSASSAKSAVQLDDVVMYLPTRSVPTPTSLGSPSTLSGSFPLSDCFRVDQQCPSALHVGGHMHPFFSHVLFNCFLIVALCPYSNQSDPAHRKKSRVFLPIAIYSDFFSFFNGT